MFKSKTRPTVIPQYEHGRLAGTLAAMWGNDAGGWVEVGPWPFSVDAISGIIIGYQQAGYPEELTPEVVPFQICRRA
jgi:hypothetical protein